MAEQAAGAQQTTAAGPSAAGPSAAGPSAAGPSAAGGAAAGQSAEVRAMFVARSSSGAPLDPAVQAELEQAFGESFAAVRIHADGPAAQAAELLNANAFTHGSDVYFAAGSYQPATPEGRALLMHELAHVAQTGGRAPEPGAAPQVADDGGAERAARSAGQAGRDGATVGDVGQADANAIHRDALGDLQQTSQGNWLGSVDAEQALNQLRAMTPAERAAVQNDAANHDTLRRLVGAFNGLQMTTLFTLVPMDLRWRIYWCIVGGKMTTLSVAQWRWIVGYASPSDMVALRAYPTGYNAFIQHAPADLVPPWDKLDGLRHGVWNGQPVDVRDAVNQLNPEQAERLRQDDGMMRVVVTRCGTAFEVFRTLTYLDMPLKWAVWYLDIAGVIAQLTPENWSQMLTEAPRQELDELVGWVEAWAIAQRHCPLAVLQLARQNNTEDGAVDAQFDDPVAMQLLLQGMGPEAFMALATQPGADVPGNYGKIKAAGLVHRTLDGLQRGPRLGERTKNNLKEWFEPPTGETDVPTLEKMMSVRFRVTTGGTGSYTHGQQADGTIDPGTNIQPWTADGLRRCWTVMERLPPAQVEQNENFLHLLRNAAANNGNAYYASAEGTDQFGDAVMGYTHDGQLTGADDQTSATAGVYQAGGQGPGSAAVPMSKFNATLRHEIGHAVDRNLGIMNGWRTQSVCGNWLKYDSYAQWVDAVIAAGGGLGTTAAPLHGYPAADVTVCRQAMLSAVQSGTDFQTALVSVKADAGVAPDAGPVSAVFTTDRWTGGGTGPWYRPASAQKQAQELGGRVFQRSYGGPDSLWSYAHAARAAREVTNYQWRAPGEWFAEVYQVYYAEQENDPRAPVGGILRSKDPEAANMLANVVDRGYSPQDVRGGNTVAAPGTEAP